MSHPDDVLVLAVPRLVRAVYLVPTAEPPDDPAELLRSLGSGSWCGELAKIMTDVLGNPHLPATVVPVAQLPPLPIDLLEATGATAEQVRRVESASHMVTIDLGGPPGWPSTQECVARALASMLAEALHSDVIDVLTHRVLHPSAARRSLPDADGRIRLADWVMVEYSADSAGYWCTTNGLRRSGLPELQTLAAPPNVVDEWARAMTGMALKLLWCWVEKLDADRDAAFVTLPAHLAVDPDDIAAAYGEDLRPYPTRGDAAATVRLSLDVGESPEGQAFLTINPPLWWSGSAGEYLSAACAALFGRRTTGVRHVAHSEDMERAIAAARARLPDIRHRFETGELSPHEKLLVKYALTTEDGTEYAWAYVTSWRDPERILATSAVDAIYDPRVRAGRPVVIDTETVVDWAVQHDERGITEGAWTQEVLERETRPGGQGRGDAP